MGTAIGYAKRMWAAKEIKSVSHYPTLAKDVMSSGRGGIRAATPSTPASGEPACPIVPTRNGILTADHVLLRVQESPSGEAYSAAPAVNDAMPAISELLHGQPVAKAGHHLGS
jgi:hypothetical protein